MTHHKVNLRPGRKRNCEVALKTLFRESNIFESEAAYQILINSIHCKPQIPELAKPELFNSAVNRLKEANGLTEAHEELLTRFISALQKELIEREKDKQNFTIISFFNLVWRPSEDFNKLQVGDHTVQFYTWKSLESFTMASVWKAAYSDALLHRWELPLFSYCKRTTSDDSGPKYGINRFNFTPISTTVTTFNLKAAVSIAEKQLDLVRALFNVNPSTGPRIVYGSIPKTNPLKVKLPPQLMYAVFSEDNNLLSPLYYADNFEEHQYTRYELKPNEIAEVQTLLQRFTNAPPASTDALLLRLFQQYQDALDRSGTKDVFLGLWQVLEALTFNEPGHDTKVTRRVANLLQLPPPEIERNTLSVLGDVRNNLVHTNFFPSYTERAMFLLKAYVDASLRTLLSLANSLPEEDEINTYYDYISKNDKELEAYENKTKVTQKVIDYIKEVRQS